MLTLFLKYFFVNFLVKIYIKYIKKEKKAVKGAVSQIKGKTGFLFTFVFWLNYNYFFFIPAFIFLNLLQCLAITSIHVIKCKTKTIEKSFTYFGFDLKTI